jgi:adenine-specific DNA glycosylase
MMELGAMACLPDPNCAACPVHALCASKGPGASVGGKKTAARVRLRLTVALRKKSVYLVRRARSASVMPSMWELPIANQRGGELFALKHSIMNTNYSVHVNLAEHHSALSHGRWISHQGLEGLPLTGLARKILHRAGILANQSFLGTLDAGT